MAKEQNLRTLSFAAHVDLSAKQFYGVSFVATGDVDIAGTGAAILGILQNNPPAAGAATVAREGVSMAAITANQNIAKGGLLEVGAGGTLIAHGSGTVVAQALEATNVAVIAIISVLLLPSNAAF